MDFDFEHLAEINGWVDWLYRLVGFDPRNPPIDMMVFAVAIFGARGVIYEKRRHMVGDALIEPGEASDAPASPYVLYLRPSLAAASRARRNWAIAHEIAEWLLRRERVSYVELFADQLAAAVIAPRQAYLAFTRVHGFDLRALARAFNTTESCMGLRHGESTLVPTQLVTPHSVRQRGEAFVFPRLRPLARCPAQDDLPRGVRAVPISDDDDRVLLIADGIFDDFSAA